MTKDPDFAKLRRKNRVELEDKSLYDKISILFDEAKKAINEKPLVPVCIVGNFV